MTKLAQFLQVLMLTAPLRLSGACMYTYIYICYPPPIDLPCWVLLSGNMVLASLNFVSNLDNSSRLDSDKNKRK